MCDVIKSDSLTETDKTPATVERKWQIIWFNVILMILIHMGSLYGIYLVITRAKWQTCVFAYFLYLTSVVGVTAGAHRLWSHRAYKAKLPLKIVLVLFFIVSFQGSIFQWVRDHRVHHRYSDTDADPHNSSRGFFYSHVGWLLLKRHPDITAKGQAIDMNDILADKLLRFNKKYYFVMSTLFCFVAPTFIPILWSEEKWTAFFVAAILRIVIATHCTFAINSVAHMWGTKPYDKRILPVETKFVSVVACGEGFHNYHHTFPWDYQAAELGGYVFNTSRLFIDIMAKIGWAYDLRTVSEEMIQKRVKRTGDGTHPAWEWNDGNRDFNQKKIEESY